MHMANLELSRGERLDQRVVSLLPTLSRSFAVKLIEEGKVTVNGVVATRGGQKLRQTDEVVVDFKPADFTIPDIDLPVLYEDDDCVVISKSIGLLTHSKGAYNPEPSVATWLHNRIKDKRLLEQDKDSLNHRAGIVHRLDRATSGVMICAKTPAALKYLQRQFAQRKTKKTYAAVIAGELDPAEAIVDMPVERNPKAPATFRVGAQGKPAVTHYKTVATNGRYSLLELKPETGRTHQLRVHLAALKHPIVGDTLYGGQPADRLYLHAEQLEITIPKDHERRIFTAPQPPEFAKLIDNDG
jgi:23S rRNA pseudouridine1911/1915/1917 synthase